MILDVPYKKIGKVSEELVKETLQLIKPEHWFVDNTRNTMTNLTQTESIILRYLREYEDARLPNWKSTIVNKQLFPIFETILKKFLEELKKYYKISDYMVFLAKLKPNAVVDMHIDPQYPFLTSCHRVHIPLITNSKVFYVIEDEKYNWKRGDIYEFDNTRPHGVINESNQERIHLLFNIYE